MTLEEQVVRHLRAELGFKAYPCCAVIHPPPADSVLSLKDRLPASESVASVQVYGTPRMKVAVEPRELRKNPRTNVEIQFSVPWGGSLRPGRPPDLTVSLHRRGPA